ncbi:membrane protein [Desulfonatronum zhilinae]|nr:membrane protein [Desulfonatronum zhilinae]
MINGVSIKQFVLDLNQEMNNDNVYNGAAALGYYLTLAIFPGIILLMTIIPYLPIEQVDEAIMDLLGQALPEEAYDMVAGVVTDVTANQRGGLLSFSLLGTIWAATTGMYAIMQHLNITYGVKEARGFIHGRATALVLSLLFGLLVIGAFSLIVLGGIIEEWMGARLGMSDVLIKAFAAFRWVVIVLALFLGFALIYRYAPNVKQKFKFISWGSVFGVTLLIIVSLGFSMYTSNFADYNATYGSIGAVIILMLWLYIVGLVILVGSEINAVLEQYSSDGKR